MTREQETMIFVQVEGVGYKIEKVEFEIIDGNIVCDVYGEIGVKGSGFSFESAIQDFIAELMSEL